MALDLGLATHQLLSALDDVVLDIRARNQRLNDAIDRSVAVPADKASFRTTECAYRASFQPQ